MMRITSVAKLSIMAIATRGRKTEISFDTLQTSPDANQASLARLSTWCRSDRKSPHIPALLLVTTYRHRLY